MYFLGMLEKILEEPQKIEAKSIAKENPAPTKLFAEEALQKIPYKKDESKNSYSKPPYKKYEKKESHTEDGSSPKKKASNCFGVYVKDGDTFEAMYNGQRVCFRLAGIDSPEMSKPFGAEAKEFLKSKILRKTLYLDFKGIDSYQREIVEAYEDKAKTISINKQILQEGFATSERYKNNQGELTHNIIEHIGNKLSETGANFTGQGMWGNTPPIPVSTNYKRKFPK